MTPLSRAERIAMALILVRRGAEPMAADTFVRVLAEGIVRGEADSQALADDLRSHVATSSPGFVARLEEVLAGLERLSASESDLRSSVEVLTILAETPADGEMMSRIVIRQALETQATPKG